MRDDRHRFAQKKHSSRSVSLLEGPLRAFVAMLMLSMVAALTGCARDVASVASARTALDTPDAELRETVRPASADDLPAGPVDLERMLEFAESHSPLLMVASEHLLEGEAAIVGAAVANPHNPEVTTSLGGRVLDDGMYMEVQVGLEQRFEMAGERGVRLAAAQSYREVVNSQLQSARWELRYRVTCLFNRSILGRERVAVAARLLRFAEELHGIAERRVGAGDEPEIVMILAQAEIAHARQAHIAAMQQYESLQLELAEIVGWPSDRLPELSGEVCHAHEAPPLDRLAELATEHHPAFSVHELSLRAAEARVRAADRDAWPEPSLGASYTREGAASDQPHIWLVTLGLPLPLWERNQGRRAEARAALGIARAERDAFLEMYRPRLDRAARAVDSAAERVAIFSADILPAFEQNLERIRRAYEMGELDIHQVSQTRQRMIESQQDALEAMEDYYEAASALQSLVGTPVWRAEENGR